MSGIALAFIGAKGSLKIGDPYQGGFYAGQISTAGNGIADYNLVVGPLSSAQATNIQWKTTNTNTIGVSSVIDGPSNSAAMNNALHPAAQFCEGLTIGGFSDWYSPAKNELEVCYYNLKPGTQNNSTVFGINANAVPARASNYTQFIPAQTAAVDFQTGNSQAYLGAAGGQYWSSTQDSATRGWRQYFSAGAQTAGYKYYYNRVRAIRRVAV